MRVSPALGGARAGAWEEVRALFAPRAEPFQRCCAAWGGAPNGNPWTLPAPGRRAAGSPRRPAHCRCRGAPPARRGPRPAARCPRSTRRRHGSGCIPGPGAYSIGPAWRARVDWGAGGGVAGTVAAAGNVGRAALKQQRVARRVLEVAQSEREPGPAADRRALEAARRRGGGARGAPARRGGAARSYARRWHARGDGRRCGWGIAGAAVDGQGG
jgi:hypothetical protein